MEEIRYVRMKPSIQQYRDLREAIGWSVKDIDDSRIRESLLASPYILLAYRLHNVIGMIRISGDLVMYGYIQDTIVLPQYQKRGIGSNLMKTLLQDIRPLRGYLLGVCPSKISVSFYEKYGFRKRPEDPNGFMSLEFGSRS